MTITVAQLTNQIGVPGPHPFLYCAICGGQYSANRGDYFAAAPDTVLTCCNEPMRLVRQHTIFEEVPVGLHP